jgi:eukaryotic-like serine/threonine-protein kinase
MSDGRGLGDGDLAAGQRFGRYVVIERLGVGGMGVVYAAHDPDLDRRAAIKILTSGASMTGSKVEEYTVRVDRDGNELEAVRERVLAEGRALARLSHPNLVTVYEVGAVGDRMFLAMELVSGPSLREWLIEQARPRREVLAAFVQAGRGLAAVHAAGLVHGDFKPDNVVVETATGRARVIDFGLARATGTRVAGVIGTPRYMAPEQRAGRAADAAADQFAFAVALYEALHGEHPAGEQALAAGAPVAAWPPPARRGPRRIESALARAMSPDPDARFPSMDSLLDRLAPRSGRRGIAALAASAILVAGAAVAFSLTRGGEAAPRACSGGPARVGAVWSAARRAELERAFAATGRPYAASSAARVEVRLGDFARAWSAMHREACLAAARGEQSTALLDRRMACLDRRLEQLRGRVALLSGKPDGALVDRALDVADLDPLDPCADATSLLGRTAPPVKPTLRAEAAAVDAAVDRAELSRRAGQVDRAIAEAREALARARAALHPPLVARAALALGQALDDATRAPDAEQALQEAHKAAELAGDDAMSARILLELVGNVGIRQARHTEARTLARLAEAAIGRAGERGDPDFPAQLSMALGGISLGEGKLAEGERLYREALAHRRELLPPGDLRLARSESDLGVSLDQQARHDEARGHLRAALLIRRDALGDDHPETAKLHANLAISLHREGRLDEARPEYLRALAIFSRIPGYTTANVREGLGALETAAGRHAEAIRLHEAVLAERRERLGADHPLVATSLAFLGGAHYAAGDPATALRLDRQGLTILRRTLDETNPRYSSAVAQIGETLRALGRPRQAVAELEPALAALRRSVGPDHLRTLMARGYLAVARIDVGRPGDAIAELDHVLARLPETTSDLAVMRFGLARGLWSLRGERRRALDLARKAGAQFAAANQPHEVVRVRAWLAHRARRGRRAARSPRGAPAIRSSPAGRR